MNYTNTSRIDVLTNLDRDRYKEAHLRGSEENLVKTTNKFVQENLKEKIKFGLSVIYFVSLIYFTIVLFI